MTDRTLIIIPARYASERLPRKMLLAETGKPLLQHTWEACKKVKGADVLIATDHEEIKSAADSFGAAAVMTRPDHPSGTARVAEAARGRGAQVIINCQGDEPEVDHQNISLLISGHLDAAKGTRPPLLSTLACPFPDDLDPDNPNSVKVVTTKTGGSHENALYFCRSLMPFPRTRPHRPKLHIGLYAFGDEELQRFAAMAPSSLAQTESLEQLTALEEGESIAVIACHAAAPGIDTREDYDAFKARYKANGS